MAARRNPAEILDLAYGRATENLAKDIVVNEEVRNRIHMVARNLRNRSCVRYLLSSFLAKVDDPGLDIRKPYSRLGSGSYSGRVYDERYVEDFLFLRALPANKTTAYLTPAFRAKNVLLTPDVNLGGTPATVYEAALQAVDDVHRGVVTAEDALAETLRQLIILRDEREGRIQALKESLRAEEGTPPLSSEGIIMLVEQHMRFRAGSSRLPVLVVAAAYNSVSDLIGERILPLKAHNAADFQTGSLGDIEVTIVNENQIVTSYEMKMKRVLSNDIEKALQKIRDSAQRPHNYIFITTDEIDDEVQEYALALYDEIGIEFVILDCIGFLRHFLHFFHRARTRYLDEYQRLMLAEPNSAVGQTLKEAFLAMRQAAESGEY